MDFPAREFGLVVGALIAIGLTIISVFNHRIVDIIIVTVTLVINLWLIYCTINLTNDNILAPIRESYIFGKHLGIGFWIWMLITIVLLADFSRQSLEFALVGATVLGGLILI